MSGPLSQSSDTFTTNMQEYDRDAFEVPVLPTSTSAKGLVQTRVDEDTSSRPPSAPPQDKPTEPGSEPPPASFKPKTMPKKVSETGPSFSSPKNANVTTSPVSSSVSRDYKELQSVLEELDDENKELRRPIMQDSEAHLEPSEYCFYLCKAAFIGGGKNFIYEFLNRFPEKIHLIENCGSSYLISLQQEIETLSPNIWAQCFPSDIVELPSRSLLSLPLTFAKLQKKILKVLENLDYIVRLSLAKEKNPVFANFLIDLEDSCSSCLISQIPNIYGLLLNDHQWTTAMRMRCFLWPCSLPNDLIYRCKSVVTLSHILNCKYFITYRSIVHDSVRDQLYAMCKSFNIEAFIEPLVRKLSSDQTDDSFGIDGVLNVVDVVSVDVCKNSAARLVYSADSPLSNAEKKKIKKYEEPLAQLGRVEHVKYQFVPFAISLFGNIGPSGLHFLENFKKVLLNRSGKTMNSTFWLNRIVFCIFKSIPTMISKALLAIGVEYERNAVSRFSNSDACLEDIEF
ncbi:hypothetical protein P9112_012512 [Eukaryota sp. TZLM1-RC]